MCSAEVKTSAKNQNMISALEIIYLNALHYEREKIKQEIYLCIFIFDTLELSIEF